MIASNKVGKWHGILLFFLAFLLSAGVPRGVEAAIMAALEGPEPGQAVTGIGIIRGWAFSDTAGVQITEVTLLLDGTATTAIPCCSVRGDVEAAFPQFPAANTRNSGFGLTFNYNVLATGTHTVAVQSRDSSGTQQTLTHTVTLIKPGGFEFLDLVDLSAASVQRQGQDLVLSGVRIRDKASQGAVRIAARLRWFSNLQGLGLVEATTLGAASFAAPSSSVAGRVKAQSSSALSSLRAVLESPGNGQAVAGIGVIRGWAFAAPGRSIRRVQLLIDGLPGPPIPCCSLRGDVAGAFPNEPNARNSGFGITFNYGTLSAGVHTIEAQIEDSAGTSRTLLAGVVVERPGNFEFLDELDLSNATVRIAREVLVVEGVRARDKATQQTATRILRYRFDVPSQAFLLEDESVDEVGITNLNCTINGDTSSVSALKSNPGADGVSLPEAIQATNNTPDSGSIIICWENPGTVQCPASSAPSNGNITMRQQSNGAIPAITRGNITIDGDVNGNGIPDDIILDGLGLEVYASRTTIRGLAVRGSTGNAVNVVARPGTSVAHVAVLGIEAAPQSERHGISVSAQTEPGQEARLSNVLISRNRINGSDHGIEITGELTSDTAAGLTMDDVTVTENEVVGANVGVLAKPLGTQGAKFTGITIAKNMIRDTADDCIELAGGVGSGSSTFEARVVENVVTDCGDDGIFLRGGSSSTTDNIVMAEIQGNEVQGSENWGVHVEGGGSDSSSNMVKAMVVDNSVTNAGLDGILMESGSFGSFNNMILGQIRGNVVRNAFNGILLNSGFDDAQGNMILGAVRDNTVQDSLLSGIGLIAGWVASNNIIMDMTVADNVVTNSGDNGIFVFGGTAQERGSSAGETRDNMITGEIRGNTVRDSDDTDIAVFGGIDNSRGAVFNNTARQNIINNTVDGTPTCENGIAGNTAECTISGNTNASTTLAVHESRQGEEEQTPAASEAPSLTLESHMRRLESHIEQLRTRAQEVKDDRVRARLLEFADRLEARKAGKRKGEAGRE